MAVASKTQYNMVTVRFSRRDEKAASRTANAPMPANTAAAGQARQAGSRSTSRSATHPAEAATNR
jgi:hypothetical protein